MVGANVPSQLLSRLLMGWQEPLRGILQALRAPCAGHEGVGEDGDEPLPGALDDPAPHDAAGVAS